MKYTLLFTFLFIAFANSQLPRPLTQCFCIPGGSFGCYPVGMLIDINGDGLEDVIYSIGWTGATYCEQFLNNGDGTWKGLQAVCETTIVTPVSLDSTPVSWNHLHATGDDVMTTKQAAEFLKTSTDVLEALLLKGEIKGKMIGGAWRVTKTAVQEYLMS